MLYTEKDKLWRFLKSEIQNDSNIELYYKGHGWSENFIVLCDNNKDWLLKPSAAHIRIYCPDCSFKLTIDAVNVNVDISSKLRTHKCQH